MITIKAKKYEKKDTIQVQIFDKVYSLPLIQHLPYKEIKKLTKLSEDKNFDLAVEAMSVYIPRDVLEELTLNDLSTIFRVWNNNGKEEVDEDSEEDLGK